MSFPSNYLNLADILATECRVTVSIQNDFPRHVLCHTAKRGRHQSDTSELPLWMVQQLCSQTTSGTAIQMVHLPKALTASHRSIMAADSRVVDLHKLGPYFYDFNRQLLALPLIPDRNAASQTLIKTMLERMGWLMELCLFGSDQQPPNILDKLECQLFAHGVKNALKFQRWHEGQSHVIRAKLRPLHSLTLTQTNNHQT